MNPDEKQAFVDSFAPEPRQDSKWDAVFLFPTITLEDYWAWYFAVCIEETGELHSEWLEQRKKLKSQSISPFDHNSPNQVAGH